MIIALARISLLATFCLGLAACASGPPVKKTTDRFTGAEVVTLEGVGFLGAATPATLMGIDSFGAASMRLAAVVPAGDDVLLSFSSLSQRGWRYLHCRRIDMLVDGVAPTLPPFEYDGRVLSSFVSETFSARVSRELVERLATAKTVELRICADEMKASANLSKELRNFVNAAWRAPR